MPVRWTKKPGTSAPYQAGLDHGLWQISAPDRAGRGRVELAYVRRGPDGRLPGIPLPIGTLSAAPEAMLVVDMYEEGPVMLGPVADLAAAHGFAGQGSDVKLLLPSGVDCVLSVGPHAVSLRILDGAATRVGRLHRPRLQDGGFVAFERPPGVEDPEALDAAALLEILDIRRARGPFGLREPVTLDELGAWRQGRRPERAEEGEG